MIIEIREIANGYLVHDGLTDASIITGDRETRIRLGRAWTAQTARGAGELVVKLLKREIGMAASK